MIFISFVLVLILIILVSFGSRENEVRVPFIGILSSVLAWVFFLLIMQYEPVGDITKIMRMSLVGPMILPFFLYYFSLVFPDKKLTTSYTLAVMLGISLVLSTLVYSDFYIESAFKLAQNTYEIDRKFGYFLYVIYLLLGVFLSCVNILNTYQDANLKQKSKIRMFIIGIFFSIGVSLIFNVFLPVLANNNHLTFVGPISLSVAFIATTYAILKEDLFNISSLVSKVGTFMVILGLVFGTFFAIFWVDISNNMRLLLVCLVSSIWIIWGQPMRQKLQVKVEQSWMMDWYDSNELIKRIGARLNKVFDRQQIVEITAFQIQRTLGIPQSLLIIAKTTQDGTISHYEVIRDGISQRFEIDDPLILYFKEHDTILYAKEIPDDVLGGLRRFGIKPGYLFVPFFSKQDLEGVMVLGERHANMPFTFHDVEIIETIALHVAVFLDRMRPYEKIRNELALAESVAAMNKVIVRINHSINSPLTGLLMCIYFLKQNPTPEKLGEVIHIIEESANNMKQVMKQLNAIKTPEWEQYGGGVDMLSFGKKADESNQDTKENAVDNIKDSQTARSKRSHLFGKDLGNVS